MSNRPILLHLGYHKTGSTFLQKNLFERQPETFRLIDRRALYHELIYPDPLEYEPERAAAFIAEFMTAAAREDRVPVISSERLSGGLHTGGGDSKDIALRLKAILPDAKILLVIREQRSMIYSSYAQFIKVRGSTSLERYLRPEARSKKSLFHLGYLEYHRLIQLYQELFGADNVLVLPFELLRSNATTFVETIIQFAYPELVGQLHWQAGSRNLSMSPAAIALKRYLNPFMLKDHPFVEDTLHTGLGEFLGKALLKIVQKTAPAGLNRRLKKRMQTTISEHTAGRYEKSNRLTAELTGLPLAEYGYAMEQTSDTRSMRE